MRGAAAILFLYFGAAAAQPPADSRFEELAKQADNAREHDRLAEASTLYERALRLKPGWAEGWWSLGTVLYDSDHYPECAAAFTRFLALKPDVGPAHALLGLCEFGRANYDASLRSLFRAKELGFAGNEQLRQVALYHTAVELVLKGNFEKALDVIAPVVAAGTPAPQVRTTAGLAALRRAQLPDQVPEPDRDLVDRAGSAMIAEIERHPDEAARLFEDLLAVYPRAPQLHYLYGSLLLLADAAKGLRELKTELEIAPQNVPAMATIAYEYLKEGSPADAVPYAERAAKLAPNDFAVHIAYGRVLLEVDRSAEAVRELETAVRLAPDSPQARFALANAYTRVGRAGDAERERKEFSRLQKLIDSGRK